MLIQAVFMRFFLLAFMVQAGAIVLLSDSAIAATSWLDKSKDCKVLRSELANFYQSLGDLGALDSKQQSELHSVLDRACSPEFSHCSFFECQERTSVRSSTATLDATQVAWLNQELSCKQFIENVKTRYAQTGTFAQLGSRKKEELRYVLDVACSERFRYCSFSNCQRMTESNTSPEAPEEKPVVASQPISVESKPSEERAITDTNQGEASSQATITYSDQPPEGEDGHLWEKRLQDAKRNKLSKQFNDRIRAYEEAYRELKKRLKEQIATKVEEEKKQGLVWQRFVMPHETRKKKTERRVRKIKPAYQQPSTMPGRKPPSYPTPPTIIPTAPGQAPSTPAPRIHPW